MKRFLLLAGLAGLLNTGCAGISKQLEFNDTTSHSLVVGYLDMEKAPSHLHWLEYKQVSPASEAPYYYMRLDNGLFYREDLVTPGGFQLHKFGGMGRGFFNGNTRYILSFPGQGYSFGLKQPGKVYFLGAYKVFEQGDFFASQIYLEKLDRPNQLDCLEMLLPNTVGTAWEPIVQRTIQALKARMR
jgi:hypothetical protein